MYELNRMRLFSVGPRGARFSDVTLDMSGAGAVVGGQGNLFADPPRRPSPYSLLMLENGGGKSVLLRLLFSVVLPGRRNAVGGSASAMEKFVLGEDPAHVALEWMHVQTGERMITGKTMQWRRTRAADGSRLAEAWWAMRPNDVVSLDTLPFVRDGRHVRLDGFRDVLVEFDRTVPATQLTWAGDQVGDWAGHLRALGIEPDLFAIQRRMNADEGDAASAFKFKSSKDFVEWLLRTALDAEDAVTTAENFDSYATTVGDRQMLLLEQEFVTGAVATLTPAAMAFGALGEATAARRDTEQFAIRLLTAVQARVDAENAAVDQLQAANSEAAATASARVADRDRARDTTNEIRRQTLALQVTDAEAAQAAAGRARDTAADELAAWATVDLVEERDNAAARAAEYAHRLAEAEQAARPALAARDDAAARLLAKLHAEVFSARAAQATHDKQADAHKNSGAEIDGKRTAALLTAERRRSEVRVARQVLAAARAAVDAAVAAGLMTANSAVSETAAQSVEAAGNAAERLRVIGEELASAEGTARTLGREATEATAALRDAEAQCRAAETVLQHVLDRVEILAGQEHVQRILGLDTALVPALDSNAEAVADALRADIDAAEDALAAVKDNQRHDQRLLDALGDGGLLPPRADVEDAVRVLRGAGLAAHAGWRYLAESVPAADRAGLVEAHPELADGVVLVDPSALPAARKTLTAARLLPAAAVAVGSGAGLLQPAIAATGAGEQFVVEPTPALFDVDAAADRRVQLRPVMAERGVEIASREATLAERRDVLAELTSWRRTCPPGRLEELTEALEKATAEVTETGKGTRAATAAAAAAEQRRAELAGALPDLRDAERSAADRAGDLCRLAEKVAEADDQQRRLPELEEAATTADAEATRLEEDRNREMSLVEEAARAAENDRDRAERHRAELGTVTSSTGEVAAGVPDEPLAELRNAYDAALAVYRSVEVGQDLRTEVQIAETAAARARAAISGPMPAVIARAEQLLASPDGADPAGRAAAAARVERERRRQGTAYDEALALAAKLRTQLEAATPGEADRNTWTVLPEDRRPRDVAHGRELIITAQADQRGAQEELDRAGEQAADLQRQLDAATEAARAFGEVATPLETLLDDVADDGLPASPATPFPGAAEEAASSATDVRRELRTTRGAEAISRAEVGRRVDDVQLFANNTRFEAMTDTARRSLLMLDRDQLAARAAEFATSLTQRLASLTTDLESAARHRRLIVNRLAGLVDGALRTLRTATRLSKLPEGLGDWTGKEFLRIRFSDPDASLLAARVGEVVDTMAAATAARVPGTRGSAPKRDAFALLLAAVDAAVPKGFTVEVLKPDSVLRDERVSIEQMNDVFSGGQELTAAIVLYCTMAALRANERGHLRIRHSGVLFLDNPIGKASAEYLLDLQQGVAAALGVQLVYTTGIFDDRALAAFPLWVRMRNDADLRAGLKHIRVAEVVRRHLPDPYSHEEAASAARPDTLGESGTVTAARVYRRPT
ncbi:hypothetical protein [Arthrobacter sp. W4I7]|uniref:hypothetical protein n=1 Tax=Arthrobacter sp. W4I7 TaxID=3042296 RepID=UPI002787382D|nr:hypothetical protein [Arthrobacter sp. W4I7]MDQ0692135.1 hypothetical protein [Arthrobacter sp. W4I7]